MLKNQGVYRVTVKRELGDEFKPEGMFSKWIHQNGRVGSVLEVSHPYGTFVPNLDLEEPITLISAGVGITPMLSILNTLVQKRTDRHVAFVHAARSEKNLLHFDEIVEAKKTLPQLQVSIFLGGTKSTEFLNGRMNLSMVLNSQNLNGRFYICGPTPFMDDQYKALIELGVSPAKIDREVFGPESLSHLL